MIEVLKEKTENSLREMEEKTMKKLKEINTSLEECQQTVGGNETVQDLKMKIEATRKTQTGFWK